MAALTFADLDSEATKKQRSNYKHGTYHSYKEHLVLTHDVPSAAIFQAIKILKNVSSETLFFQWRHSSTFCDEAPFDFRKKTEAPIVSANETFAISPGEKLACFIKLQDLKPCLKSDRLLYAQSFEKKERAPLRHPLRFAFDLIYALKEEDIREANLDNIRDNSDKARKIEMAKVILNSKFTVQDVQSYAALKVTVERSEIGAFALALSCIEN